MATTGYYLNQFVSKNLSGAVSDTTSTTGITLDSVTGIDTTKPGIAALTWGDPLDEDTVEWITYTSINGSNEFVGVTRGAEGGTARTHENGAVVAFPISESHINNLATALSIGGSATNLLEGILDEDDMASNSATKGTTQQAAKAYVDSGNTTIARDTITEKTAGSGVTVDGLLIKDGDIPLLTLGAASELTISDGAITVTGSYHIVDTEGDAATDDLTTINGGEQGQILILRSADTGRDPTLVEGANIFLAGGNFTFSSTTDHIVLLKYSSTIWVELSRSDNA